MPGTTQLHDRAEGELADEVPMLIRPPETEQFLHYYDAALEVCPAAVGLFTLPDRQTFASRDTGVLASQATRMSVGRTDVYLHVHLHDLPEGEGTHRGSIATMRAAIGLFSDIDACGPGRKKPPETLCPSVGAAISVVEVFNHQYNPLRVSVLIGSGHGCYPLILLKEPFLVQKPEDKVQLESLGRRFHEALRRIASERGWTSAVDYCDLAKVLRLPGCMNWKDPSNPKPVRLLYDGPERFNLADLDELLPTLDKERNRVVVGTHIAGNVEPHATMVVLDPHANPPFDKFEALRINEPRFSRSWEHQRSDLKDQSQSAYDQSLANFAARVGWSDQDITNLIIANRRRHGADLKLREDYYQRTTAAARKAAESVILDQRIAELVQVGGGAENTAPTGTPEPAATATPNESTQAGADINRQRQGAANSQLGDVGGTGRGPDAEDAPVNADSRRRLILETLSARFKVRIQRIVRYTGEPTLYRLETAFGNVQLGGVAGLIGQSKLRISIADATGRYLPHFDPDVWPAIAQALLDACEIVDRGEDATMRGTMSDWLRAYLAEKSIHPTLEEADEGREPFLDGGDVIIFSGDLKRWLHVRQNERVPQNGLTADLRTFGAQPQVFKLVNQSGETTRSAWRLPAGPWIPSTV